MSDVPGERGAGPLQPQLAAIIGEYEAAGRRLHELAERVPREMWPARPEPESWSVAECVAHLNLTSEACIPILREGIERARALGRMRRRRYRRGPIGWLLWRTMGPPVRFRVRTAAAFVPTGDRPPDELIRAFDRLQAEQLEIVQTAEGLPIDRVKVTSPFNERVRYNVFACLSILPPHQHRHLWQAERARARLAPARDARMLSHGHDHGGRTRTEDRA